MIVDRYIKKYKGIDIELEFNHRITVIGGDSASGKSFIWKVLKAESVLKTLPVVCLNYECDDILEKLKTINKKLIVIDNADMLLNSDCKEYIGDDANNQYLIFSRKVEFPRLNTDSIMVLKFKDGRICMERDEVC